MNSTCYKQYDTRWASLPYPKKPWLIRNCGCGEVSICNAIIDIKQYANETPKTIQPYMKQFAESRGNGTYHYGIPTAMKHFGMTEVAEHATMSKLWAELRKGGRNAVLLMGSRSAGSKGVKWTGCGHFVEISGYKEEGGKHWVYVKDSASTSSYRNGWITYEDNIRGACLKCWSGKLNGSLSTATAPIVGITPDGKLTIDGIGGISTVKAMQRFFNTTQDGVISGQNQSLAKWYPALKSVKYAKGGSPCVKNLQRWLGITQDGIWGKGTSIALQKKLGVTADGIFGKGSMSAWQKYLNANEKAVYPQSVTPTTTTTTKYSGTIPSIHVTKSVQQVINDSIKWGKWIASDNSFHYGYGKDAHHNGCYFCGTQPASKRKSGIKDWQKTYCCNPFVHACFAHGGLVTAMLSLCEKGKSYGFAKSEGYAKLAYFKAMGKLSASKLVAGDVLCSDHHVALYIGGGKVVQASGGDNNVPYSTSWNKSISVGTWNGYTRVYRLIKGVNADVAIRFGEYSDRVKQLQQFLNWYNGKNVCNVDGIFGEGTLKYVKAFQTAQKIAVDGIVGNGTISKMKSAHGKVR